jgi:hypothetical protein
MIAAAPAMSHRFEVAHFQELTRKPELRLTALELQTSATLGMLTASQAERLSPMMVANRTAVAAAHIV